jgi:hypothetical protein
MNFILTSIRFKKVHQYKSSKIRNRIFFLLNFELETFLGVLVLEGV